MRWWSCEWCLRLVNSSTWELVVPSDYKDISLFIKWCGSSVSFIWQWQGCISLMTALTSVGSHNIRGDPSLRINYLKIMCPDLVYVCEPSADRVLHPRGSALYCVSKEKSDYNTEHRPAREVIQTPLWWPTYLFMRWTNQKFVSLQWKCFMPISSYKKREGQSMTIWLRPKQYISQGKCLGSFEKGGVIFYKSHIYIWYILHNEFSIWVLGEIYSLNFNLFV